MFDRPFGYSNSIQRPRSPVQMVRDIMHPEDLATFDAVIARGMTGADVDFAFGLYPVEVP